MSAFAAPRLTSLRVRARPAAPAVTAVCLVALTAVSVLLRMRELHVGYWVDEGISLGISSHSLSHLPALLRQDGAPPLYYALLHFWIDLFGSGEAASRSLSLVFGALSVPAGLWAGWSLFGRRAGWIAAGGAALSPFLAAYSQESRMYSLVVLLSILCTATWALAFVFGRRRYVPVFAVTMALLLYTHTWALFFLIASGLALLLCLRARPDRRGLVRDALIGYGLAGLLFAPWVPTLLFQARHTGAPWALKPDIAQLWIGPVRLLGGPVPAIVLVAGVIAGALALRREGGRPRLAVAVLAFIAVAIPLGAWLVSQASPAWAWRYMAAGFGPLLLLAALALSRLRRMDVAVLAVVGVWWAGTGTPSLKSNARTVTASLAPALHRGDWLISTQPEQLPVLYHYLRGTGVRPATPMRPEPDPGVVDWRDALGRLRGASPARNLVPILNHVSVGGQVLLMRPIALNLKRWSAPWQTAVRIQSSRWTRALLSDPRFRLVRSVPLTPLDPEPGPHPVRGLLFRRVS